MLLFCLASGLQACDSPPIERERPPNAASGEVLVRAHRHVGKSLEKARGDARRQGREDRRILITIDDLPLAMYDSYASQEERRATVRRLTRKLAERGVPFVGFFNMARHGRDPTLTDMWLEVPSMRVGNHTWAHPHPRKVSLERYLEDVERGHRAVRDVAEAEQPVPFRYPYLARGFDPKVHDAIRDKLAELDSPVVPITIDTLDWLYARDYLDALHDADEERASRLRQEWLWKIREETMIAEAFSRELFGRLAPQVLLIHANRLNADHLDLMLDWLEECGYRFVTLAETLQDPAYAEEVNVPVRVGASRWRLLLRSRQLSTDRAEAR